MNERIVHKEEMNYLLIGLAVAGTASLFVLYKYRSFCSKEKNIDIGNYVDEVLAVEYKDKKNLFNSSNSMSSVYSYTQSVTCIEDEGCETIAIQVGDDNDEYAGIEGFAPTKPAELLSPAPANLKRFINGESHSVMHERRRTEEHADIYGAPASYESAGQKYGGASIKGLVTVDSNDTDITLYASNDEADTDDLNGYWTQGVTPRHVHTNSWE